MKILVTGGTGFIGSNLVRALLQKGFAVKALARSKGPHLALAGLDVEMAYGDLRDQGSLRKACAGCDALYHVAAFYQFWAPDPKIFYQTNVQGTKNILEVARDLNITKVVYTSTVGTLRYPKDPTFPSNETCVASADEMCNDYKRSKFLAEQIALQFAAEGLPVVIVNPSTPIGPFDVKPTPTGRIIVDFLTGRVPAYLNTGLNIIDVEDVVAGHILAAEQGKVGERYILGNQNISLKEIYELIAKLARRDPPFLCIPYRVAWTAALGSEWIATFFKRRPKIPLGAVRMAKDYMYFDSAKAVRELGLPQRPITNAFAKAIQWFQSHGYLNGTR